MIHIVIQIVIILGYLSVLCSIIRAYKMVLLFLTSSIYLVLKSKLFKVLISKKIFPYIFHIGVCLFLIYNLLQIVLMIKILGHGVYIVDIFYFYVKNIFYLVPVMIFLRLVTKRLQLDIKKI